VRPLVRPVSAGATATCAAGIGAGGSRLISSNPGASRGLGEASSGLEIGRAGREKPDGAEGSRPSRSVIRRQRCGPVRPRSDRSHQQSAGAVGERRPPASTSPPLATTQPTRARVTSRLRHDRGMTATLSPACAAAHPLPGPEWWVRHPAHSRRPRAAVEVLKPSCPSRVRVPARHRPDSEGRTDLANRTQLLPNRA
jgi:hypothetical protein